MQKMAEDKNCNQRVQTGSPTLISDIPRLLPIQDEYW